jgi:hypothetical protein
MPDKDFIEDITDAGSVSSVAVAEPGGDAPSFSPGTPPKDHRIRVDSSDLDKGKGESKEDFSRRKREYATTPDPYSPTGRKKHKVYLYDFDVKCIGTKKTVPPPARIKGVPAAPDAIREFLILRKIKYAAGYRFRAFPVPNTKRDAGDAGYASSHIPESVRLEKLSPEDRATLKGK